jgi:hypothetical protein
MLPQIQTFPNNSGLPIHLNKEKSAVTIFQSIWMRAN